MAKPTREDLKQRISLVEKAFDTSAILSRVAGSDESVARYYRLNKWAYKLLHSKENFVHMGISRDGVFKPDDFYGQARAVQERIDTTGATNVLELAAGKGANIRYLAGNNPEVQFYGLDLPNGHLQTANPLANLHLSFGDYHDLSQYQDSSMDIVYIIEALCHAHDRPRVIAEVARVLKPGGQFVVFDGYTTKPRSAMDELELLASDLTFNSMMVDTADIYYGNFKKDLAANGLNVVAEEELSVYVLPSMKRLEPNARRFLQHPHLARLITKVFSDTVTGNAIAGYLMPITTEMGIHCYWYTLARKTK
jgi:ubiquinone/menaquinone biosynthesis C-methylase UbiE